MARSVGIFLGLLAGIVLFGAALAWWLGPNLVHLTLLNSQRHEPFTVLNLARGLEVSVYEARYRQPLVGLITSEGGVEVDSYRLSHMLVGQRDDEWQYLMRMQMQEAQDITQVMTASPYRLMSNSLPALEHQLMGSFHPAQTRWRDILVVWLLQNHESSSHREPLQPVLDQLGLGDGRVVWDAQLTPIEEDVHWQRMVVMDFSQEQDAFAWLRHADVTTAYAITNARTRALSISVFNANP